jgi:Dolichyl-phosphate-mannose-protein mannosyltransferase
MKHIAILAVLIGGFLGLASHKIIRTPYSYDEADYMFAASLGYYPNWMDTGSVPILDFIRIGLERGGDPRQRLALSQFARDSKDPVVYRHWHGPLYYYWLAALTPWHLPEGTVRCLSLTFPILTAISLYLGTLWVLPEPAALPAAMLACALFLWGQMTVKTTELAPHMFFILCYVPALLLLAKIMQNGNRHHWYIAVVLAGLAFCTLEVAFVLIATLAICGYLRRRQLGADWAFAGKSLLVLTGTILLIWPAALLKINFLKAYLFMAYLAIFRKGAWGGYTVPEAWMMRFAISPLEWLMIAAAAAICIAARLWRSVPGLTPFAIYSLLMLLAMARVNGEGPRYLTPFFPAMLIFASWTTGVMLARTKPHPSWLGYTAVAGVSVLLFFITHAQLAGYLVEQDPRPAAILAAIRAQGLEDKRVLVPQSDLPTLHYYFPKGTFHGYLETGDIPQSLAASRFDAVLYPQYPVRLEVTHERP